MLDDFLEKITVTPETPAAENLFNVRDNNNQELLDKTWAQEFHHAVEQLLFTGIRCRKDVQTTIYFLTTRVRKPDKEDWKKLSRLLGYQNQTIKLPLILRADVVNMIKWWVDASYADHDDMQGYTGGTMSMRENGHGSIISISRKQKLNTKRLMEGKHIEADRAKPQMLCTRHYLEAQVYRIDENILYQDNMSAIILENNGKKSSTKNMKHINVHYYFIKDQVETGDMVIEHCPTEEILGDHFTKPLQGALFRKFRAEITNIPDDLDMGEMGMSRAGLKEGVVWKLHNETDHGFPQECVGYCDKVGRENGAKECSDGRKQNGTYNTIILEKGERSRAARSYADVTRGNVEAPLGQNRLIIS